MIQVDPIPSSPKAFKLMMEGSEALADVEANGMRIDVAYLDKAIKNTARKAKEMEQQLKDDDVFRLWRKRFGHKASLGSHQQLGSIIFDDLGVECKHKTKTGKPKTDIEALEDVDHPFVRRWSSMQKLNKARNTYLKGIRTEIDDNGFLHPFFHLHFASTFRSSSSEPNLQNQPIRDPRQAKLIRRAFIPRSKDHILVEIDQGALEFRGAANFWGDPKMIDYACDPKLDIHRDIASLCYKLSKSQVTKGARYNGKNKFVFPILYGSYYRNCANNLWMAISQMDLKTEDGISLFDHLKSKGIDRFGIPKTDEGRGTFIGHIKTVEDSFNKRFSHWSRAKDDWWDLYCKRGWFQMQTGFVCKGIFSYNNLMNTPIQGASFHLVLWAIIELNRWLKEKRMQSKIICTIHDSILFDLHKHEAQDVLNMAKYVMTEKVREYWTWIKTTLEVEAEASSTTWYEKKAVEEKGGKWVIDV